MSRARVAALASLTVTLAGLLAIVLMLPGQPTSATPMAETVREASTMEPRNWLPIVITSSAAADNPDRWQVASRWTYGPAHLALPVEDTTYFAYGAQIEVLDTSSMTVTVEATLVLTSAINDMLYHAPYLLLANNDAGLVMLDVTADITPTVVGARAITGKALRVEAREQRAYVLFERTGLHVFDISNPANIVEIGSRFLSERITALARKDATLYIGTADGKLLMIDASDDVAPGPANPVPDWDTSLGPVHDLVVVADRLYVAHGSYLSLYDVATPLQPVRNGRYQAPDNRTVRSVAVDVPNNRAYLAQDIRPSGFRTIDITNPNDPREINSFVTTPGPAVKLFVQHGRLHLTALSRYQIIELANPQEQPERLGRDAFGTLYDLELDGSRAFISGDSGGVALLDISVPEQPTLISRWRPEGWSRGIAISGTLLYSVQVVDGDGLRLAVGSFETPDEPVTIAMSDKLSLPLGELSRPFELALGGGYAYVAGAGAGLLTFDIQGERPVLTSQIDSAFSPRSVDVNGPYLYAGTLVAGAPKLRTYVTDLQPGQPMIANETRIEPAGDPGEMIVDEVVISPGVTQRLLFANASGALAIFGLSKAYPPDLAGSAGTPAPGGLHYGITKIGRYVYVTDPVNRAVHVYNVSRYFLPTLYTDLIVTGEPASLHDTEDLLLINDERAGLVILH